MTLKKRTDDTQESWGNPQVTQDKKIPQNLFLRYLQLNNLIGYNAKAIGQRSRLKVKDQKYVKLQRFGQIHTYSFVLPQIHKDARRLPPTHTNRTDQMHKDTHRITQSHAISYISTQIRTDPFRFGQCVIQVKKMETKIGTLEPNRRL